MKKLLAIIFLLQSLHTFACGAYDEGPCFHRLFRPNSEAVKAYTFLLEYHHYPYESPENDLGNLMLWKEVFPTMKIDALRNLIYGPQDVYLSAEDQLHAKDALHYITYAKSCSNFLSYKNNEDNWDYTPDIKEDRDELYLSLIEEGQALLAKAEHPQLPARYYYQIIRLLHYSEKWEDAIALYEATIKDSLPKNEIYYYILDHIAGCYYAMENYDMAEYLFTKVLCQSKDRKVSAYNSLRFCAQHYPNSEKYFVGKEDLQDYLFYKSQRNFWAIAERPAFLKEMMAIDPNDTRMEVILYHIITGLEEQYLSCSSRDDQSLEQYKNTVDELFTIVQQQTGNKAVSNKSFWLQASSYLSFLNQDLSTAKATLKKDKSKSAITKTLTAIYKVYSWEKIGEKEEKKLAKLRKSIPYGWEVITSKLAEHYTKQGEEAKRFLLYRSIDDLDYADPISLLDAVEKLYHKTDKNEFEKSLVRNNKSSLDYLIHQKGLYYFMDGNLKRAAQLFQQSEYQSDKDIPATIFSNNIKECYECPFDSLLIDSVYLEPKFSFINKASNRYELSQNLIKLEELCQSEDKETLAKSRYLLGNFYYNISQMGYYRGLLVGDSNCCGYRYSESGDYPSHFDSRAEEYFMEIPMEVLDDELKARLTFMMAKIDLSYASELSSWDGFIRFDNYYESYNLKALKESYQHTKFQQMIIKECSYYQQYLDQ